VLCGRNVRPYLTTRWTNGETTLDQSGLSHTNHRGDGCHLGARAKVDELLKDEQKKQLKEIEDRMKAFVGGMPGFGPGGPTGRGRPGGPGGFGGMGGSATFRAYRYGPDYPGLAGKDMTPGKTIEELDARSGDKKN